MAEDYDKWVAEPGHDRVLLCDVGYWDVVSSSAKTFNLSTHAARDFGYYNAIITRTPYLTRKIPRTLVSTLVPAHGFVDINIADGRFDDMVYNNFGGRVINFYHGDKTWAKADFRNIFSGTVTKVEVLSDHAMRINFTDSSGAIDAPLSETLITVGPQIDKVAPITYGHVQNITPVLLDDTTNKYKMSIGPVEDVVTNLYFDGELQTGITVTKDNANGEFTLSSVSGAVTLDGRGLAPSAGASCYLKPGAVMQDMLTRFNHVVIGDIDTASVTAYDTAAPDIGYFIDEDVNVVAALRKCVECHLGWYSFNRAGEFSLHTLAASDLTGTPVATFNDNNIVGDVKLKHDVRRPTFRTEIGHSKNWTIIQTPATTLTDQNRIEFLRAEYRFSTYTDANEATIKQEYADAVAPPPIRTLISNAADALAEATARQAIFNQQRYWIEPKATALGLTVELGDLVEITSDRFSLSNRKYLVMSLDDDMLESTTEIGGWF